MTFFDQVVAATKLNPMLAPFVVRRICVNQDVVAAELDAAQLRRIMPKLVDAVVQYLEPAKVPAMREALERLARPGADDTGRRSA